MLGEVHFTSSPDQDLSLFSDKAEEFSAQKSVADGGRMFSGIIYHSSVDRHGVLRFQIPGIDFSTFKKTGAPINIEHQDTTSDGRCAVVARALKIHAEPSALMLDAGEFDIDDPLADHWRGKVQRKFIRAMSASLMIKKAEMKTLKVDGEKTDILDVSESELMHIALVSQPRSGNAVIHAASESNLRKELQTIAKRVESLSLNLERVVSHIKLASETEERQGLSRAVEEARRVAAIAELLK